MKDRVEDNEMLKNPVVVDNQEQGKVLRFYGSKGPEGTAIPDFQEQI